jgi:hypothetical protein
MTEPSTEPPTLDDLLRQRARDMRTLIDRQNERELLQVSDPTPQRAAGRELEWLAPEVALQGAGVVRTGTVPLPTHGVVSPFTPSMLIVVYTTRYYVAAGPKVQSARGPRDVFTVYGELQAALVPAARGIDL